MRKTNAVGALGLGVGEETAENGDGAGGAQIHSEGERKRGGGPERCTARERAGVRGTVAELVYARRSGGLCARVRWKSGDEEQMAKEEETVDRPRVFIPRGEEAVVGSIVGKT